MGGQEIGRDPAAEFLAELGYAVVPVDWSSDELPPGARKHIGRMRLMCHYPDGTEPFQVFHVRLAAGSGTHQAVRPMLDPLLRRAPQANYLFLISPAYSASLLLVNPVAESDWPWHVRYRTIRVVPGLIGWRKARIIDALRLRPEEQDADRIAEKHRYAFDEWQRWRRPGGDKAHEPDLFRLLLADMQAYPVLGHGEQIRLIRKAKGQGPDALDARHRLVAHNLRLVIFVAKKYRQQTPDFMDLIQEGVLGLNRAIDKFDERVGSRFSTYAVHWIGQAIRRAIADHSRTIRLPVHLHEALGQLRRASEMLGDEFGREPNDLELALGAGFLSPRETDLGWLALVKGWQPLPLFVRRLRRAAKKVRHLRQVDRAPVSLERELPLDAIHFEDVDISETDMGGVTVADLLPVDIPPPFDSIDRFRLRCCIEEALTILPERRRHILKLRYGLEDGQEWTLEEIGQHLGVTRERIRQIEKTSLVTLSHPARSARLREFLQIGGAERAKSRQHLKQDTPDNGHSHDHAPGDQNASASRHPHDEVDTWLLLSPEERWSAVLAACRADQRSGIVNDHLVSIHDYLDRLPEDDSPLVDDQEVNMIYD